MRNAGTFFDINGVAERDRTGPGTNGNRREERFQS